MLKALRNLFRPDMPTASPGAPPGERIYAIGDIHGRLDLLEGLAQAIEQDNGERSAARTTIILLGDLIDRGPNSAGVIDFARRWQQARPVRILCGNHEEMLLESLTRTEVLRHFLRHGGRETILSYGLSEDAYRRATLDELQTLMHEAIPGEDIAFIRSFEDSITIGDYLFVHAGIAPQVALDKQSTADLRWIREPFLSHEDSHSHVVVHGHTITPSPVIRHNRIGIDTGAYLHGRLTALVLEGTGRRLLAATDSGGAITIETSSQD